MTITKKFEKIKSDVFFSPLVYNGGKVELEASYLIRGFTVFIQKSGKAPDLGPKKKKRKENKTTDRKIDKTLTSDQPQGKEREAPS